MRSLSTSRGVCFCFVMNSASASTATRAQATETLPTLLNLPPFPAVALRALNVLSGTDTSLRELCDLIRTDAVFSAEILRIANSPLIAFSKEITSVLQASMLLGFQRLRRLVVTVALRSYLDSAAPLLRSCWRHSVACAILADQAARWISLDGEFAYTAGILHDIGRVVLTAMEPDAYVALLDRSTEPPLGMLRKERDVFVMDHCQAGSWLLAAWNLPRDLATIAAHHHEPLTHQEDAAEVIRLSCLLANALGFAVTPHNASSPEKVLAEFPESVRMHLPKPEELTSELTRQISAIELA